jgi:hypothetical protein
MRIHQGSLMLVTQLLAMSSPSEMNEMAQMCLKGEGIGMFVSQFWKMKVDAENTVAKGGSSKKKKKAAAAAGSTAGPSRAAASTARAAPAVGATQGAQAAEESGWHAVGGRVKAKGAKGKGDKKGGPAGGQRTNGQMGGAFAMLPMI